VLVVSDVSSFTQRLRVRLRGGCSALRFLPGSALLAACSARGVVVVVDARDGAVRATFEGHAGPVFDVAWVGRALWTAGADGKCRKYLVEG